MLVFISHQNNQRDNQVAGLVCQAIEESLVQSVHVQSEYGTIRYFVDIESLHTGDCLDATIEDVLQRADVLIVLLSPAALQSRWVHHEITRFQELHPHSPILPIFAQTCQPINDQLGTLSLLMGAGHERIAVMGKREDGTFQEASEDGIWRGMHNLVGFCILWRKMHASDSGLGLDSADQLCEILNTNWYDETLK